ncbi:hypothetical protein [Polynucleobacter asymbioticus]|jgi:hypothetical protein|uniref:Uncharacterized protein n=1 Tax=Polynucleobacter asymbioticus TaxID=576611 RepID=A0AAC9IUU8_9BURK|nr:hypothetical protein [Polynucleobacter asymbioticus]APC01065.1 hypothetical protein AOC25_05240 [Polynucleobacter asymbioticus]
MTSQFTRIYDLAYCIADDGEEVALEQSNGSYEELDKVNLNRLHVKLLAEKMNITQPSPLTMSEIVKIELLELLDSVEEYWED